MKPIIGMFAKIYNEDLTCEMYYQYSEAIEKAGGIPVLLPYVKDEKVKDGFIELCDGFFFTGGVDVNPIRYGEKNEGLCGVIEDKRDELEFSILPKVLKTNKPILAICRGMQLVNVYFGGTLYQDIPTQYKTDIVHTTPKEQRFKIAHDILVKKDTPLYDLVKTDSFMGNTFHHQAVKELGNSLSVMATAKDGIVEAYYKIDYPYLRCYQWHPERLINFSSENLTLFEDFIETCKK